jgi:CUB domain
MHDTDLDRNFKISKCMLTSNQPSSCIDYLHYERLLTSAGSPCAATEPPENVIDFSGTLTSLNYPNQYPNYADCRWLIASAYDGGVSKDN